MRASSATTVPAMTRSDRDERDGLFGAMSRTAIDGGRRTQDSLVAIRSSPAGSSRRAVGVDPPDRLEYIVVSLQHIGPRRAAEAAREQVEAPLRQAEKLGTVGKLVGGIAHDFNNRLAIIMGYGDLLSAGLASDDPLSHYVAMVMESAKGA